MAASKHPTKADFADAIVRLTHAPAPWAEFRTRTLSEAGILPQRRERLTYSSIAGGLCGFYGSDAHGTAADRARRLYDLPLTAVTEGRGLLLPRELSGLSFGQVLTALLRASRYPNSAVEVRGITCCSTHDESQLILVGETKADPASYVQETYHFGVPGQLLGTHVFAVKTKNEVSGSLFRALASLGSDPEPLSRGTSSRGRKFAPKTNEGDTLAGVSPSDRSEPPSADVQGTSHKPEHIVQREHNQPDRPVEKGEQADRIPNRSGHHGRIHSPSAVLP